MTKLYSMLLSLLVVALTACAGTATATEEQPQGRLLVWHPFMGKEAEVFNAILDQYSELYPGITIVREQVDQQKMSERFLAEYEAGFGPDVMINLYAFAANLVAQDKVQKLEGYNIDTSIFGPAPLEQVTYRGHLYGIPLALDTLALCYNKTLVDEPAPTFTDLISEARAGLQIGLLSRVGATYWGIPALGGRLLDESGRVVLDQGGAAAWWEMLKSAKNEPTFIFSDDRAALGRAFSQGQLAYYICEINEINQLQEAIGPENFGIAPLPTVEGQPGAPFLLTYALFFNPHATQGNSQLALQLANFLTNTQQQQKLGGESQSLIPANNKIKVDERLSPLLATVINQARASTSVPLDYAERAVAATLVYGDPLLTRVLEGEIEPAEAAAELSRTVNQQFGLE